MYILIGLRCWDDDNSCIVHNRIKRKKERVIRYYLLMREGQKMLYFETC